MATFDYGRAWKNEKTAFERTMNRKKPSDTFLGFIKKGSGISGTLSTFDGAKDLPTQINAYKAFVKAKNDYDKVLLKARGETDDRMMASKVDDLRNRLADLQQRMETEINQASNAAPKPVGKVVPVQLLRKFDLAADLKSVHLTLSPMWVEAHLELDKAFERLIDDAKEGFKVQRIGDAVQKVADTYVKAMQQTLDRVDRTMTVIVLQGRKDADRQLEAKRKEALDVLTHARQQCVRDMNAAAEKEWKAIAARKEALKSTRITIGLGITSAGVNIALNSAHIVATGGVTWLGVVSLAKGVVDLSHAVADALKSLAEVEDELVKLMGTLYKLGHTKQTEWHKLNPTVAKGVVGGSELASWASYTAFARLPSFTRAEFLLGDYRGKVSQTEGRMDDLVGRLNKLLRAIDKGDKAMSKANSLKKKTAVEDRLALLRVKVVELLDEVGGLGKVLKAQLASADRYGAFLDALKRCDVYQPKVMKTGAIGGSSAAVGGLAYSIVTIVDAVT